MTRTHRRFSWLRRRRPPPTDGRMTLVEHLRELRSRLFKAVMGIALATVAAWFFYEDLFRLLEAPFDAVIRAAADEGREVTLALTGVTDPFFLQLKISLFAGVVLSSPVWLYQIWAFVTPGLHRHERRWSMVFFATAVPLFLAGCLIAYLVLPKGLQILLGFTPQGVENLITLDRYLNFVIRMILVFGIGFELPVFIVLLSAASVLSWRTLRRWARVFIFGVFVFSAVATPTGDPITMLFLAVPLLVLLAAAYIIALIIDRRRRRAGLSEPDYDELDDDQASPLDERPQRLDDTTG
jgi:sec-independent protein translocase protein TatC